MSDLNQYPVEFALRHLRARYEHDRVEHADVLRLLDVAEAALELSLDDSSPALHAKAWAPLLRALNSLALP